MLTDRRSIAVLDAGWYTTEHLFRAVDPARADTLLLKCMDFVNARRKGIPPLKWLTPTRQTGPAIWERDLVLPPGWMGRFASLGMRPIARTIQKWRNRPGGGPLTLVVTYPQYLTVRDRVRPETLVYYNVDDYRLYWPDRAEAVDALERKAVREADLTVCVAKVRADELRASVPESAHKIIHLPHGAPESALSPETVSRPGEPPADLRHIPRPLIGFVGSLEGRVDWPLLERLAIELPHCSIVLVGDASGGAGAPWYSQRASCLARPNVHAIGPRPQSEVPAYNRCFDVSLIPYLVDHPFNTACSPTKIMDCLAAARPLVSIGVPECRLYEHLFDVRESAPAFIARVRELVEAGSDDGRGTDRLEYARAHTCEKVVGSLLDRLEPGLGLGRE